jgi:EAL domain-containing protein (putative c-di-GMP-specific phosphodiesterase class I)
VFYQPIVNASDGKIVAAEALARISDIRLGAISPAEFIPIAEQCGLILDLGKCVRSKVWELISNYDIRAAGVDHISINLSALECTQKSVMEDILREERLAGAGKGLVNLEITETAAVTSEEALAENVAMMRDNGFAFYLDDYGTGYSGMSNLISLPFDVVKIDRSIVNMAEDERRGKLVRRMIFPFHGYGIKVVCEGIETDEQAQMVRGWGADYIQGYLYSKPLPPEAFIKFANLKKRKPDIP